MIVEIKIAGVWTYYKTCLDAKELKATLRDLRGLEVRVKK